MTAPDLHRILSARTRTRAAILVVGVGLILLMHGLERVLFGQSPGGEVLMPLVSTVVELWLVTLLARYLERRDGSAVAIAVATCVAMVVLSTAFMFLSTLRWGLVGAWRLKFLLVGGAFAGLEKYGLWVLAFRYPLLVDEARVHALEMERARQAAELAQLREHLHPHFLRNTLNAIAALVTEDPVAARNLLADLGDLLGDSIDDPSPFRTLSAEIEWLKRYAEILEIRYRGTLRFHWEEDPEASATRVPRLLLQPLVENAIHHGALAREHDRDGQVIIRTHANRGGRTVVEVVDNGPGFDPKGPRRQGLGLRLVQQRVETEARGTLRIESDPAGTRAVVELP